MPETDLPPPLSNSDFDFFYQGLESRELLVQQCDDCGAMRNPPVPACGKCHSLQWKAVPLEGTGTVHSYVVHYHPPLPNFATPHPIALVTMREGLRMVGAMDGIDPEAISIGMEVEVECLSRGGLAGFRFRPKSGAGA